MIPFCPAIRRDYEAALNLTLPLQPWELRSGGVGGSDVSATGVPEAYEIRRDRKTHDRISDGPRHKANVGVRVVNEKSLSGMFWVNFFDSIEFVDKATALPLGSVPSYTLLNAKLWYPFSWGKANGRVFLQGFNLLDRIHREHPQGDEYGLIAMAGVEVAW